MINAWIADLLALAGFVLLTIGIYLEFGIGLAVIAAGAILLILGVSAVLIRGTR